MKNLGLSTERGGKTLHKFVCYQLYLKVCNTKHENIGITKNSL